MWWTAPIPSMDMQMHVVYETLRQLEITDKEIVTVFNKIDRREPIPQAGIWQPITG